MYPHESGEIPERHDVPPQKASVFAADPQTCPKCLGPIEPERLPGAKLCLDCNVVR